MDKRVKCWGNPFIEIDLTSGEVTEKTVEEEIRKKFLMGRGIADWLLLNSVEPGKTDPLGPDNVMICGSGIFLGTPFPGAARTSLVSLNPFTNGYGESSNAGPLGIEIKKAGYDGIIVSGRSPVPVYLRINDGEIELKDATNLMGRNTFETSDAIK